MSIDVVDLRTFYGHRLGTVARRFVGRGIRARWADTRGLRVLGIGYATPYLGQFREEFEFALGRRVSWSFRGHQLKIAPHAFPGANAFYSRLDRALLFGYFATPNGEKAFTCLSHHCVAHRD